MKLTNNFKNVFYRGNEFEKWLEGKDIKCLSGDYDFELQMLDMRNCFPTKFVYNGNQYSLLELNYLFQKEVPEKEEK